MSKFPSILVYTAGLMSHRPAGFDGDDVLTVVKQYWKDSYGNIRQGPRPRPNFDQYQPDSIDILTVHPQKAILSSSFMTRSKVSVIGMALWSTDTTASPWTLTSTRCFQTMYAPFPVTQQRIDDVNSKLPTTIPNTSRRHAVMGLALPTLTCGSLLVNGPLHRQTARNG
jgi:hypothetical protein